MVSPPQFLSAFEANPVSMLSHVHPPLTMEGEGQGDTPQQGRGIINGFGQHVAQCVCICVCRWVGTFQACKSVSVLGQILYTGTHSQSLSVWIFSKALLWNKLGKAAGALNRTQREKQREGDCRVVIKFHFLFARPSPPLPLCTFFPLPSNLSALLL